jgi:methylmalonyl-CoA/ethylmalonyl-CoA epimerase
MVNAPVRVAHVGIAVASIATALPFYRDVLGLVPGLPETADGATIVSLTLGDVRIELLEPIQSDRPIAKFLAGAGRIHHICYRVPIWTAPSSCAAGYQLVDPTPRLGAAAPNCVSPPQDDRRHSLELTE